MTRALEFRFCNAFGGVTGEVAQRIHELLVPPHVAGGVDGQAVMGMDRRHGGACVKLRVAASKLPTCADSKSMNQICDDPGCAAMPETCERGQAAAARKPRNAPTARD